MQSAQKLLDYGAYPDALNKLNCTPFTHAVEADNTRMANILPEAGANSGLHVNGQRFSDRSKSKEMVKLLADYLQGRFAAKGRSRKFRLG